MSYWVYLEDDEGRNVAVESHEEGGTYVLGGTGEAELNVTYSYARHFAEAWPEPIQGSWVLQQMLDGKKAAATVEPLESSVSLLGTERDPDYWASTPGNAGAALAVLLGWARQHPHATWRVS